ncbi:MAG TPA: pyridoxal phosphate-dependent aminotransferase [Ktedonobacterales bacterium]
MNEVRKRQQAADDFYRVNDALQAYTRETGREPLLTGGWEVEDPAIGPPAGLVERLWHIAPQPGRYAYGKEFHQAKARAAEVLQAGVRLAGRPMCAEQVAVLQNSSQGLLLALTALRERGARQVVIAAPTYYATVAVCQHLGLEITLLPAADYLTGALDMPRLARALKRGQSILILINPAYSIGVEYPRQQVQALCALAGEQGAWVLLDETRLGLHWQADRPWYAGEFSERTLILRSPSKIFLLNGMKTSFLLGPAAVIHQIERLSEALVGSTVGNAQSIALAYLDAWHAWLREVQQGQRGAMRAWKQSVVARLQHNRDLVGAALEELGFSLSPVDSGPYLLAGIPRKHLPALDSVTIAQAYGVLLLTSNYFYHWNNEWWGFRVNLCGDARRSTQALMRVLSGKLCC